MYELDNCYINHYWDILDFIKKWIILSWKRIEFVFSNVLHKTQVLNWKLTKFGGIVTISLYPPLKVGLEQLCVEDLGNSNAIQAINQSRVQALFLNFLLSVVVMLPPDSKLKLPRPPVRSGLRQQQRYPGNKSKPSASTIFLNFLEQWW